MSQVVLLAAAGLSVLSGGSLAGTDPAPNGQLVVKPARNAQAGTFPCCGVVLAVTGNSITVQPDEGGPPRPMAASTVLAAGGYSLDTHPCDRYKLADVRAGDKVFIDYSRHTDGDVCEKICIRRRPGGRVPPAHDEPRDPGSLHHEVCNAIQDWEEHGIPIPDDLHPGGNEAGVAPLPRVAIPPIPPAAP